MATIYDVEENRLEKLVTTLSTDLEDLDAARREKLIARVEKYTEKLCTVT